MAIRSVSRAVAVSRRQRGMSLIELMVATGLGMTILVSVGTTFLAGQRMASEKMNKLLLNQSIVDALKYIAEDGKRAGYNGSAGSALKLVGMEISSLIHLEKGQNGKPYSLTYTYRKDNGNQVTSFWGDVTQGRLMVCSRHLDQGQLATLVHCNKEKHYESLMDDRRIRLTGFDIKETPLGAGNKTALYEVTIAACIKQDSAASAQCNPDPDLNQQLSITFKQRNWQ